MTKEELKPREKLKKLTEKNDWISFSYFYALSKLY